MKYIVLVAFIVSMCFNSAVCASQMNTDTSNLAQTALSLYNKSQYKQALVHYETLLKKYPKDFLYNYYAGVCLLKTRHNIPLAVAYLKYASTKLVPDEVYFYLGQAYQLNYEFNNAIADYDQYLAKLPLTAITKKEETEYYKQTAINARKEVQQIKQVALLMADSMNTINIASYMNEILTSGKFIPKPEDLRETGDDDLFPYLYYPNNKELRNLLFFTGIDKGRNKNSEVLYSGENPDNTWQPPINPGYVINTAYNEYFAFFDSHNNILYFSSDGPGGMGGYDNYFSVYNPTTKTWSSPVNIGFPINTPYDDMVLIPSGTEERVLHFFSNRATSGEKLMAYKIKLTGPISANNENTLSPDELMKTSLFLTHSTETPVDEKNTQYTNPSNTTIVTQNENWLAINNEEEYNALISKALYYQLRADSASRAIFDHQQELQNNILDAKAKTPIYQDINRLNTIKKDCQQEADRLFSLARYYEQQSVNSSYSNLQGNYQESNSGYNNSNTNIKQEKKNLEITEVNTKETEVLNEFKIYNHNMYSEKNPIPLTFKPLSGLMYTIQLGAFSKPLAQDHFKGIYPICGELIPDKNITKYYAGKFTNYQQASRALQLVKTAGFIDAYLIAYMDGTKVSINRAEEIEKEMNSR